MTAGPPADGFAPLIMGFGTEEVVILFAPGGMFRSIASAAPWRAGLRFLAPGGDHPGLLAEIPRAALRPLLAGAPGHEVEAEFKRRLFELATPAEWPEF